MLIRILSKEGDESLPQALDTLEELYKRKGKLEERADFLQDLQVREVLLKTFVVRLAM